MTSFVTKRISALFTNDKHENDNEKDYYNDRIVLPLIETNNTDNYIRTNNNANYKKKKTQKKTNRINNEYNSHSNITTNAAVTRGGGGRGGLLPVLLGIFIGSIVFCITQLISSYFYHSFYQDQSLFLSMDTSMNMNSPPLLKLSSSTTNNNNPPPGSKRPWMVVDDVYKSTMETKERNDKKVRTWWLIYEELGWNELPDNIRDAAITLGYNILIWERDEKKPESGEKRWNELHSVEQQAAGVLGYTKKTWNHEVKKHKKKKKKKKSKNSKQQQQQQQIKQPKKQGPLLRQPQRQHQRQRQREHHHHQQQQQQQSDKQHQQQQQHQQQRPQHRVQHYFEFWRTLQASLEGDHDLIMAQAKEIPPSFVYYQNQSHQEQQEEAGDNNEKKVLSSLEILRQILRSGKHKSADEYYQHNFGQGEKSDRDRSNSNNTNTNTNTNTKDKLRTLLPQCLQPNLSSSKKIATTIMQQRRYHRRHPDKQSPQQPLGPFLNMGFPEMGSTATFVDFFRCAGSTITSSTKSSSSSNNNTLCAGGTHPGTTINNGHRYQVTQSPYGSGDYPLMESLVVVQETNNYPVRPFDIYPQSGNGMNNYHRGFLDEKRQGNPNVPLHQNTDPVTVVHLHLEEHNNEDGQGSYPQIQLLDEMHTQEPNSVFLLSFRPVQEWIQAINTSVEGPRGRSVPLRARLSNSHLPGLETTQEQRNQQQQWSEGHPQQAKKKKQKNNQLFGFQNTRIVPPTELQLVRWWCGHVLHLREYVKLYPSHTLIEFEFDDPTTTTTTTTTTATTNEKKKEKAHDHNNEKDPSMDSETTTAHILGDIFDIDYNCWNHCNTDAKEEEEENKKRRQKRREHK